MKKNAILILSFVVFISLIFSKNAYADEHILPVNKESHINYLFQSIIEGDMNIEEYTFCARDVLFFE